MPRQKRHKRRTQRGGGFFDGLMGPDTPDYTSSYIDSKKKDGLLSNIFGSLNIFGDTSSTPSSYTSSTTPSYTSSLTTPSSYTSSTTPSYTSSLTTPSSTEPIPEKAKPAETIPEANSFTPAGRVGGKRTKRRRNRKRKSRRRRNRK